MKHPDEEYVTLHGSVLVKAIIDITAMVRQGWTQEDVEHAIQGLFAAIDKADGTIDDIEHFQQMLLSSRPGSPDDVTQH